MSFPNEQKAFYRIADASETNRSRLLNYTAENDDPLYAITSANRTEKQLVTSSNTSASNYLSEIEQAILRSHEPIQIDESEEITVLGQRGIWANKQETNNWNGTMPLNEYLINEDPNPEILTKRTDQSVSYVQELAIRYLRPPTPPAPGEIIIQQQTNSLTPPAPPLIIRQQPVRAFTPEPIVIREAPPSPPKQVGRKVITISGRRLPPPPRKVVVERLAELPSKPQSVIIERWLPYSQLKRRVIYQRSAQSDTIAVKPKNVIIQWGAPDVRIRKDFKYLGIIRANPAEYVNHYGHTLKSAKDLPDFVLDIKPPQGVQLAADVSSNQVHVLEGEVHALKFVDLEREGLSEYKNQVEKFIQNESSVYNQAETYSDSFYTTGVNLDGVQLFKSNLSMLNWITEIFNEVDKDQNGSLSMEEARKLLIKLNSQLNRDNSDDDIEHFFNSLEKDQNGRIGLKEFRRAFEKVL